MTSDKFHEVDKVPTRPIQCFQAVTKMIHKVESGQRTTCILEIGDKGIKMVDKSKPGVRLELDYN